MQIEDQECKERLTVLEEKNERLEEREKPLRIAEAVKDLPKELATQVKDYLS